MCLSIVLLSWTSCDHRPDTPSLTLPAAPDDIVSVADVAQPSGIDRESAASRPVVPRLAQRLEDAPTFSVMTWNLEWFFDDERGDNYSKLAKEQAAPSRVQWDWRRDQVAASLSQVQPSIVALQEVENKRVLWYLTRSLARSHELAYEELCVEGSDVFTEQDVGFLYRSGTASGNKKTDPSLLVIEPTWAGIFGRTAAMRQDESFADVSKHLCVQYELSLGDQTEKLTVLNLHLRAKEEAVEIRTRQARTAHAWIANKVRSGENVIVLGDFNTDEQQAPAVKGSDMHAACGFDTPDLEDDLIDLHSLLPEQEQQTHLLAGKAFDRILVSPSLLQDDPSRPDLCLVKFQRWQSLAVKGRVDTPQEHWDHYWQIDEADRDLSDHWPLMATFQLK